MTNSFLVNLFNLLQTENIKYSVLRNWEELPFSTNGSDVDILVTDEDLPKFIRIYYETLKKNKGVLVSFTNDKLCPRLCCMGSKPYFWGIQIDLHIGIVHYNGKQLIPLNEILSSTFLYNNVNVLSTETEAIISFFKEILNNSKCKESYFFNLKQAIETKPQTIDIIRSSFGTQIISTILEIIQKPYNKQSICKLAAQSRNVLLTNWDKQKYRLKKILKISRIKKKPGYTIAFLGTDGSGKSTIINNVIPLLNEAFHNTVYYEHMRPNRFSSLAYLFGKNDVPSGPVTNPHDSAPSGIFSSVIRFGYYLLDYTIGYYLKIFPKKAFKSSVWIFDRYFYDYYIDQKRSRINLPKWMIRMGQIFIPEPDIIICLGTDSQLIHSRKPELTLDEVERQVRELKKFASKHKKAVWVDTGTSIEESSSAALHHIVASMAKRFEKIKII